MSTIYFTYIAVDLHRVPLQDLYVVFHGMPHTSCGQTWSSAININYVAEDLNHVSLPSLYVALHCLTKKQLYVVFHGMPHTNRGEPHGQAQYVLSMLLWISTMCLAKFGCDIPWNATFMQ